ncbi:hypothetical protein ABIB40_002367 [Pedobacter sp. UYP30]|uniref:hypothetical protein n=1 Tax=Pedobacter sp. UYP30 TaxID=1756400 RepID=UPI003395FC57
MKRGSLLLALVLLLSCQKKVPIENLTFESCNLASTERVIVMANQSATLTYTKKYRNFAFQEYTYIITLPDTTAFIVCNMPPTISLKEGKVKNIVFSGNRVVPPFGADYWATKVELIKLRFVEP